MDEFALIDRYFRRTVDASVHVGIGDDAAVIEVPAGRLLVAAVDTQVQDVHFPKTLAAADIGYRSLAVNLSDLAAMGAIPKWMTLALSMPVADPAWLEGFSEGLFAAADEHGVSLTGGDTTRSSQTVISVQLLGHVDAQAIMRRDGCDAGHRIFVTGHPGDAAAGLALIQQGEYEGYLQRRFGRPTARVKFGQVAAAIASAAIDISDGLAADLKRLLAASGCGATIDVQQLPLSQALSDHAGEDEARRLALTGGDDYELCLTASPAAEAALFSAAEQCGVELQCIGIAESVTGLRIVKGDKPFTIDDDGYRHF